MSRISQTLESWRLRAWVSKFYFDAPVTNRPSHLEDIARALGAANHGNLLRLFVNGHEVAFESKDYRPAVADVVQSARTYEEVRSVALTNGFVSVSLARAAIVSSVTDQNEDLGVLWAIRDILDQARWPFGAFLFRYFGSMTAATLAFLIALFSFDVHPTSARNVAAVSVFVAWIFVLVASVLIGLLRMVRLDVRMSHERARGRVLDLALQGVAIPVVLGLILNALKPWLLTLWEWILRNLSY